MDHSGHGTLVRTLESGPQVPESHHAGDHADRDTNEQMPPPDSSCWKNRHRYAHLAAENVQRSGGGGGHTLVSQEERGQTRLPSTTRAVEAASLPPAPFIRSHTLPPPALRFRHGWAPENTDRSKVERRTVALVRSRPFCPSPSRYPPRQQAIAPATAMVFQLRLSAVEPLIFINGRAAASRFPARCDGDQTDPVPRSDQVRPGRHGPSKIENGPDPRTSGQGRTS